MKHNIQLTTETEDEAEVLERLVKARDYAVSETDMDSDAIANLFAYMSTSVRDGKDISKDERAKFECPECGLPAKDTVAENIGEMPTVVPCGCKTQWGVLPPDVILDE